MQLSTQISGLKELEQALQGLEKKLASKIARRAVAKGALTTVYAWREAQGPMSAALVPLDVKTALQNHFGA